MKRRSVFSWIGLWLLLVGIFPGLGQITAPSAALTNSQAKRVIAKGVGAIIAGDRTRAADDAIANALKNAIEQTVGMMIQSDVLVKNYQILENHIFTRTTGYIQSYRVLAQNEIGTNILEVTIEAFVNIDKLIHDLSALGILFEQTNYPLLVLLLTVAHNDTHSTIAQTYWNPIESEIRTTLQARGFPVVEMSVVAQKVQPGVMQAALAGDEIAIQQVASLIGVEVLIFGKATARVVTSVPVLIKQAGLVSCQATVELQAVHGADGMVIITVTRQASAAHMDSVAGKMQALQKAAHLAAIDLADQIMEQWRQDVRAGSSIQLKVLNIPSYMSLLHLKNWLMSHIQGVRAIQQREFNGGTALLDLQTTINSEKLAEEIALNSNKSNTAFSLDVLSVTADAVVVKMVHRNSGQ